MATLKDMTGERFGRWIVLEYAYGNHSDTFYKCRCDCGIDRLVRRRNLRNGITKSCGCLRAEQRRSRGFKLEGKIFHDLTVIQRSHTRRGYFLCQCVCGKTTQVAVTALTRGIVKSCGCKNGNHHKQISWRTQEIEAAKERAKQTLIRSLFRAYQNESQKRVKPWNISIDDFSQFLFSKCHYCDSGPSNERKHTRLNNVVLKYNGLDRLDNTKGYSLDNCVSCCKRCNSAKNDMTQAEFKEWIIKVYWKTVFT